MRCFYVLYVYQVQAHFVQGFPLIKALANYCHPTVRWGGLWEKIKSGIKFFFKINLLVATGYAPLAKPDAIPCVFVRKCAVWRSAYYFFTTVLGSVFYLQSRVAYFAPLVVLRKTGWGKLRIFGRAEGFGFTQTVPPIRAPLPPRVQPDTLSGGKGGGGGVRLDL